jgi:phage terminase large subunit-like protein
MSRLQLPARYTKPLSDDFLTDGDKLIELVRRIWRTPEHPEGIELDEWQQWLIRHMLERYPEDHPDSDKAGMLRLRQICISLGRQNGKSLIGAILAMYGLLMHERGPMVLSLASSSDQARLVYDRVLFAINEAPALAKRFKKATGTRGIVTADGAGRYDVKAAKEAALQGIPASLVIFDEGHLAKRGMWSASVFGTSQRQQGFVAMITTAGDESSETLIDLYKQGERAINGDPDLERFGFFVWESPAGCDILDPEAIMAANPSVAAGRIPMDRVLADLATIPEHEARRYRLNQFVAGASESWMPMELFHKAAGNGVTEMAGAVLGVDITGKWEFATIAAANKNGDILETELVASIVQPNENQLYKLITETYRKHSIRAIAIDSSRAPNLAKRLKLNGYVIWQLYSKEVSAAASQAFAAFSTGKVRHNNDPLLIAQWNRGVAKYVGDSWFLSRRMSIGEIDGVLATIFALYVAGDTRESIVGVF